MSKMPLKEEKGSILFLVILSTAVLLLLGTAFLRSSLQEKLIARNYTQKIKAHYIAEAGMEAALTLLRNQPDYFLKHGFGNPVYMDSGTGSGQDEEYFELEWLELDSSAGQEELYTLTATGYTRSTFEDRSTRAVIEALVRIDRAGEDDAGDENSSEEENGIGDRDDNGDVHDAGAENNTEEKSITLLHLSGW